MTIADRLWRNRWVYLFLLPTIILYCMYTVWPVTVSYWYSLLDWNGFERSGIFVGLDNYRELWRDSFFWHAFGRTFLFAVITVPLRVGLALLVALILNDRRLPFSALFRTALFLPVVTTTAIIGIVMAFVFDPAGGPVNAFLLDIGVIDRPINFLGDSGTALYTVMGVHIWKWFGVTLIYWLASLQTIPDDLIEASQVDGSGTWETFRNITLPLLLPFLAIITALTFLDTLEIFDLMLTMTGGGPFYATEVIDIFIYRQAFASPVPRLGYASAAAVLFGIATLLVALIQFLIVRKAQTRKAAAR